MYNKYGPKKHNLIHCHCACRENIVARPRVTIPNKQHTHKPKQQITQKNNNNSIQNSNKNKLRDEQTINNNIN